MIPRHLLAAAVLGAGMIGACSAAPATPSADPLAEVLVSATVGDTSLVATGAFADFGVTGGGARQVRVRIVDSMDLALRVASDHEIVLAEPPIVCLVGPYSAPDDAGLESACWGEPDLGAALAARLTRDANGHYVIGTSPIDLRATLNRGTQRCDYPPGKWEVELKLRPLGSDDGRYVPDATFDVPIADAGPLTLLPTTETRYCGLATAIVQQQGEPEVVQP